jgi:hypothetical protein
MRRSLHAVSSMVWDGLRVPPRVAESTRLALKLWPHDAGDFVVHADYGAEHFPAA